MVRHILVRMAVGLACVMLAGAGHAVDAYRNSDIDFVGQVFSQPYFADHRPDIVKSVHVIGVLPLDLGAVVGLVPNPEAAAVQIEKLAEERLVKAGIKVIPASAMRDLMTEAHSSIGDIYDAHSGQPRLERLYRRSKFLWDEEFKRHPADAYLVMTVVGREAEVNRSAAKWDGIEDAVSGRDALMDLWKGPAQQFATIPGYSLAIWLIDPSKHTIYASVGGLHLGAYIRRSGKYPEYFAVAQSDAIVSDSRVARALDIALHPAFPLLRKDEAGSRNVSFPRAPAIGGPAPGAPAFLTAAEFRAKYKKIALTPVLVPSGPKQAELDRRYESVIQQQLQAAGFEVVGSDAFIRAWQSVMRQDDDLFDPRTGRRDEEKLKSVRAQAASVLKDETHCDALVLASVVSRPALFLGAEAHWLGASEIVTGDSTALAAKLGGGGNKVGTILATALSITVLDLSSQVVLYEGAGGIELRAHLESNGFFTNIPPDKLFVDPERDETAVSLALTDLINVKSGH